MPEDLEGLAPIRRAISSISRLTLLGERPLGRQVKQRERDDRDAEHGAVPVEEQRITRRRASSERPSALRAPTAMRMRYPTTVGGSTRAREDRFHNALAANRQSRHRVRERDGDERDDDRRGKGDLQRQQQRRGEVRSLRFLARANPSADNAFSAPASRGERESARPFTMTTGRHDRSDVMIGRATMGRPSRSRELFLPPD